MALIRYSEAAEILATFRDVESLELHESTPISSSGLDSADLIVANDSGPMHLAAAMHKPVVALFGPTDPKRFGPWGQMENVLSAPDADLSRLPAMQVADFILQKLC